VLHLFPGLIFQQPDLSYLKDLSFDRALRFAEGFTFFRVAGIMTG